MNQLYRLEWELRAEVLVLKNSLILLDVVLELLVVLQINPIGLARTALTCCRWAYAWNSAFLLKKLISGFPQFKEITALLELLFQV